jgi:hypothetical protein
MNRTAKIVKIIALTIMSLAAMIIFWPFAIAGIVAFLASGMRFNRWVSSACAILAAVIWRLAAGEWSLRFGDGSFVGWYSEAFHGIVNWALAAIFVSGFAHWCAMLVEGYKSAATEPA